MILDKNTHKKQGHFWPCPFRKKDALNPSHGSLHHPA
jgi:hypothetical protein